MFVYRNDIDAIHPERLNNTSLLLLDLDTICFLGVEELLKFQITLPIFCFPSSPSSPLLLFFLPISTYCFTFLFPFGLDEVFRRKYNIFFITGFIYSQTIHHINLWSSSMSGHYKISRTAVVNERHI